MLGRVGTERTLRDRKWEHWSCLKRSDLVGGAELDLDVLLAHGFRFEGESNLKDSFLIHFPSHFVMNRSLFR